MKHLLTTKRVPVGKTIDSIVKNAITGVDYSSTAKANVSSSDTLTVADIRRAVKTIKQSEIRWNKWANKMTASKSWQKLNKELHALVVWLDEQGRIDNDLLKAYDCLYAIQPNTYHAVHAKTKDRVEELLKEHKKWLGGSTK